MNWTKLLEALLTPRSIVTLALYATLIYLMVRQLPIPDYLKTLIDFLLGFWFGSKIGKGGGENGSAK